jgi:hypothetical protein
MVAEIRVQPHTSRRVDADPLAHHLRHDERDPAPVLRCAASVRCPNWQDHVAFALASLSIGLVAMVTE